MPYNRMPRSSGGSVLEQSGHAVPLEVMKQLDASQIEIRVARNSPEEVRILGPVGQDRVRVGVRKLKSLQLQSYSSLKIMPPISPPHPD